MWNERVREKSRDAFAFVINERNGERLGKLQQFFNYQGINIRNKGREKNSRKSERLRFRRADARRSGMKSSLVLELNDKGVETFHFIGNVVT